MFSSRDKKHMIPSASETEDEDISGINRVKCPNSNVMLPEKTSFLGVGLSRNSVVLLRYSLSE